MKLLKTGGVAALLIAAGLTPLEASSEAEAPKKTIILLTVDETDPELAENLAKNGIEAQKPQNLEELLDILDERPPLSKRHERLDRQSERQQRYFLEEVYEFLDVPFDPDDPEAEPDFVEQRERLVRLIFGSATERSYYQRLYLLNKIWLDHQDEFERFNSLDLALRDYWLSIEEHRRKLQRIIMGVTAVGGMAVGGYLSYAASTKILPIAESAGTLGTVLRWAGRSSIIVVGAYVGGRAGAYIGFLGSDYLLGGHYDFVDPIDGDEELRDILDVIEQL